ncbi:hypothetical protein WAI453_009125 [Rhynchosporium graminicola]
MKVKLWLRSGRQGFVGSTARQPRCEILEYLEKPVPRIFYLSYSPILELCCLGLKRHSLRTQSQPLLGSGSCIIVCSSRLSCRLLVIHIECRKAGARYFAFFLNHSTSSRPIDTVDDAAAFCLDAHRQYLLEPANMSSTVREASGTHLLLALRSSQGNYLSDEALLIISDE